MQAMRGIRGSPLHPLSLHRPNFVKDWLGMTAIDTTHWGGLGISEWLSMISGAHMMNRKAMATLTLLIS
jgi:hypothetical protein